MAEAGQSTIELALAKIREIFSKNHDVEFIPGSEAGKGRYVHTVPHTVSKSDFKSLGFAEEAANKLESEDLFQWLVPHHVMTGEAVQKVIPGAMGLSAPELTQAIRRIPGHKNTRVVDMAAAEYVHIDVRKGIHRHTLIGADVDKNVIGLGDNKTYRIIVPEQEMHDALRAAKHLPPALETAEAQAVQAAKKGGSKTAWIVGGVIALATAIGVGAWILGNKDKSQAARETDRRQANQPPNEMAARG